MKKVVFLTSAHTKRLSNILKPMDALAQRRAFGQVLTGARHIPLRLYLRLRMEGVI